MRVAVAIEMSTKCSVCVSVLSYLSLFYNRKLRIVMFYWIYVEMDENPSKKFITFRLSTNFDVDDISKCGNIALENRIRTLEQQQQQQQQRLKKEHDIRCVVRMSTDTAHHQCWCVNIFLAEWTLAFWQFIIASCFCHYYAFKKFVTVHQSVSHSHLTFDSALPNHQWIRPLFASLFCVLAKRLNPISHHSNGSKRPRSTKIYFIENVRA